MSDVQLGNAAVITLTLTTEEGSFASAVVVVHVRAPDGDVVPYRTSVAGQVTKVSATPRSPGEEATYRLVTALCNAPGVWQFVAIAENPRAVVAGSFRVSDGWYRDLLVG